MKVVKGLHTEFCMVTETVNKWKYLWERMTIHMKAKVDLESGKIKAL
jgi:hypothetical protein